MTEHIGSLTTHTPQTIRAVRDHLLRDTVYEHERQISLHPAQVYPQIQM